MKPNSFIGRCVAGGILVMAGAIWCKWQIRPAETSFSRPRAQLQPTATTTTQSPSWRQELTALHDSEAVAWLNTKLDSGEDSRTGEGFVLAPDGDLKQAPTWRVCWLEELGQRDPIAAAHQAEKMLVTTSTPEEWAVALRWLARGEPQARALLEEKTRTLLSHEPWKRMPTVAWLEAFDAAVYLGGTSLLPELTDMARDQRSAAASHASFLALDRLVQENPASVLSALQTNSELLKGREAMRGNLFARADVGDPEQERVLEDYLLTSNCSRSEIEAFADVFPNANFHLSANLLTISQLPDPATRRKQDSVALAKVRAWRTDIRFATLDYELARIQSRLEEFVAR